MHIISRPQDRSTIHTEFDEALENVSKVRA